MRIDEYDPKAGNELLARFHKEGVDSLSRPEREALINHMGYLDFVAEMSDDYRATLRERQRNATWRRVLRESLA